jgi:hypothetical protein
MRSTSPALDDANRRLVVQHDAPRTVGRDRFCAASSPWWDGVPAMDRRRSPAAGQPAAWQCGRRANRGGRTQSRAPEHWSRTPAETAAA